MRKMLLTGLAAGLALGASGTAVALRAAGRPHVERVMAQFQLGAPTIADHHECEDPFGILYDSFHVEYPGTQTSTFPDLEGDITIEEFGLVQVFTNLGSWTGTYTLTDPNTGELKAKGTLEAVVDGADTRGFIDAKFGAAGGKLRANFVMQGTTSITGELGGDPTPFGADPAVFQTGSCI